MGSGIKVAFYKLCKKKKNRFFDNRKEKNRHRGSALFRANSKMEENLTYQLLKYQFFNGCEKVKCSNPLCIRNPTSIIASKTKEEKLKLAEKYSNPEDKSKLCDGIPLRFSAKKCFHTITFFDNWARNLKNQIHVGQAVAFMQSVFNNPVFAGYILLQDNVSMSKTNPSIDEVNLLGFINKLSAEPALNEEIAKDLKSSLNFISDNVENMKFSYIRLLLILFYFPSLLQSAKPDALLPTAFTIITKFNKETKNIMLLYLSKLTELRRQMIGACHFYITYTYSNKSSPRPQCREVELAAKVMAVLYEANKMADNPLPPNFFVDSHINETIDPNMELFSTRSSQSFSFIKYPFLLSLKTKVHAAKAEMRNMLRKHILNGESKHMKLKIRRSSIVSDAVQQILAQSAHAFVRKLRVSFDGEKAIDAGGPSREFLYQLSEKLLSPDYGMFVHVGGVRWFSQSTLEGDRSFFLVGTVLGLAIRNNVILPIRFPRVLYKKLLEKEPHLNLGDLAEVMPEVAKSLNSILEMRAVGENVSELDLTFETTIECFGQNVSVPLIEGMGDVEVTNDNVEQYIQAYVNFELDSRIKTSFEAFKRGFDLAYPGKILRLLEPAEMDTIVSGEEVYDWFSLKTTAKYVNATERSRAVQCFWEVFDDFPQKEKLNLLKFITGSDRTPLGGLKNVKITINITKDIERLPTSHTCFSILDLPAYPTTEKMAEKIKYAINETEGFGLI